MFTALQLAGLILIVVGAAVVAGIGGGVIGAGVAVAYIGLAGER